MHKANSYLNIPGGHQAIALSADCCTVTRTSTCIFLRDCVCGKPSQRIEVTYMNVRYAADVLKTVSLHRVRVQRDGTVAIAPVSLSANRVL